MRPFLKPATCTRVIFKCVTFSVLAAVLIVACGESSPQTSGSEPAVLATTTIWADVVENVSCASPATVEVIIPAGSDPHGFEPSLADRGRMDASALIVANGLALEEGLDDTIEASSDRGTPVFRFSDHIAGLEGAADGVDPHIWFDPTLVAEALPALADALVEHVALDEVSTRMCMEEYQRELADLDREIQQLVAEVPADNRKLVTNHDSLHYFADRYGFEVIGTVIPAASTLAETNPAQLEGLATLIDDNGIPAIFVEALQSTDDADVLARRVGVQVVRLDTGTLGPEGEGADSYIGLLRTTAELISGALD